LVDPLVDVGEVAVSISVVSEVDHGSTHGDEEEAAKDIPALAVGLSKWPILEVSNVNLFLLSLVLSHSTYIYYTISILLPIKSSNPKSF